MDRLLVVFALLAALLLVVTPSRTVAEDATPFQDFDRDACYDNCPCNIAGFEQACGECIQKCDREFWKSFDEKSKELEKEN
jgi:hypothetical protein